MWKLYRTGVRFPPPPLTNFEKELLMANYDGAKMKKKLKSLSIQCNLDALTRHQLRFTRLNGRNQSKVHGKDATGYVHGSDSAVIEDILHTMGCDLFGGTRYNITIHAEEIEDVRPKKKAKKEEGPREKV